MPIKLILGDFHSLNAAIPNLGGVGALHSDLRDLMPGTDGAVTVLSASYFKLLNGYT